MTTVQQVFELVMAFTDNVADSGDAVDYGNRCIPIINSLAIELYPYSSLKSVTAGVRALPVFAVLMTEPVDLDDGLARGVLPHGVVAELFVEENPRLANYHALRYAELRNMLRNTPAQAEDIENVYGSFEHI